MGRYVCTIRRGDMHLGDARTRRRSGHRVRHPENGEIVASIDLMAYWRACGEVSSEILRCTFAIRDDQGGG